MRRPRRLKLFPYKVREWAYQYGCHNRHLQCAQSGNIMITPYIHNHQLTLMPRRIIIQLQPRIVSHNFVLWISENIPFQISIKLFPDTTIPRISLTWDVRITRAAADVKPEPTGPDIKSIRNPRMEKCLE